MNARVAALDAIRRGWAPVPVPRGGKAPILPAWQKLSVAEHQVGELFIENDNVGFLLGAPSGGLVDVDVDSPEACAVASILLPSTDRRHGRPSRPGSHYWYVANDPDISTVQFLDPNRGNQKGATLVELRGTGSQTVVPGSFYDDVLEGVRPGGECLEWEADGEPARVGADEIKRCVAELASAALIARYWPSGARHAAAGALAGFLLRRGVVEEDVVRLLDAICNAAGDREQKDRRSFVRDTARTVERSGAATGRPRLAEILGEKTVEAVTRWLRLRSNEVELEVVPLDVFGDATLAGNPPLPLDSLPLVIRDFAADEAERLGVTPALVALPCLVVAAAATHDGFVVQPRALDTEWTESARLWMAVVGEPGSRKTPALRVAIDPLRMVEREWLLEDQNARKRYEVEAKVYAKQIERWTAERAKGAAVGNEPREPDRPPHRRRVVSDLTVEALSEILVDNPSGVLCCVDELTSWFGSFDAYRSRGGKDRALWLSLYEGGPTVIDRVKRGLVTVPNWSASLLGGIQSGPMRRLGGSISDDGLLARMIIAFAEAPSPGVDRLPDVAARTAYRSAVTTLASMQPRFGQQTFTLAPDSQTERRIVEETARSVIQLPDTSAAFKGHLSKWPALFARLALTIHLIQAASKGCEPEEQIGPAVASGVARLMLDYLLPNAARFYTELLGTDHLADSRWIAGYVLAHRIDELSARDIGRAYRELRGKPDRIASTMEALHVAGWVTPIEINGARPRKWIINPRVHSLFAARATQERERRERVRREIAEAAKMLGLTRDQGADV